MTRRSLVALTLAILCAGCSELGNLFSSSTTPSPTGATTDSFAGSVVIGGSSFFTFEVVQQGTVNVTLTSLGASGSIGLGIGTPNGTSSCQLVNTSPTTVAGSTAQISVSENTGSYCVEVFDAGALTASTTFAVSVVHS